ncbi:MAG: alpha-L-arabinofuranosidase C-terminal domain-containing protein, partial [Chloroflexota bacterium]
MLEIKKICLIFLVLLLGCSIRSNQANSQDNTITIYYNREIGQVNKKIFGNNFVGGDPVPCKFMDKEYYGHMDYGEGIWDPKRRVSVKDVIDLAKEAGITIVRFPGGCVTHHYNWKAAIGKEREHFLYGIDEFLKTCAEIGAEPVMTVSYFTGNEQDAADLVEYLNCPNDGSNPNGGVDWAAQRAENGHPLPYIVRYFEVGNEVWHGDHQNIKEVLPEEYAERYLKYYEKMKAVDPSIKIGCILYTQDWNRKVLGMVREKVDFGIVHTYPSPEVSNSELAKMSAEDIFRITFINLMALDEYYFQEVLMLLKKNSGRDIPIAITEYNGGFVQEYPVPYRHCLGTALLNAEMLRIFMKPEHNILMANYWDFVNEYWGMVANGFYGKYKTLNKPYYKRPNYYVYELYNKHFGDILIGADVNSNSYIISKRSYNTIKKPIQMVIGKGVKRDFRNTPYLSVNASRNENGSKIYLMVINKNMDKSVTSTIELKNFVPAQEGNAWILNGPSVDATNEKNPDNVRVKHRKAE